MGEGSLNPTDPHHTPTFIQPSTSEPQKKQKPRKQSDWTLNDADMFDVNTLTGDEVLAEQEVATKDVISDVPVSAASTKFDEEEIFAKEKDEANVALTEEWDDIQAKVDADYQLAQRLQAEEQEQFITEQKATLFKELLEQRRKHFAGKRAEEKRNKPPTKNQQKKTMITYLKNMEGWKHKDLKSKYFNSIKELFDKAFKRVNMFMDYRTDLVEDDVQETTKVDDDQEAAKIKELIEIVPYEDEVAIDAIPLYSSSPIHMLV
ncbi:hypothetical protein Tco_0447736 [Tanacetum coccineum]